MPKIVEIEGIGPIEVPDDATDQDVGELAEQLTAQRQNTLVPRDRLMPETVSTTAGGPRTTLPTASVGLGSLLQEVQMSNRPANEPLPFPEPGPEFIERNPRLGSALQRGSQILGGLGSREAIATMPLFTVPYVGPGLALGLGAKGVATGLGEVLSGPSWRQPLGSPEAQGGGGMETFANALMLTAGGLQARRPIQEATPQGQSRWALIDQLKQFAEEPTFGRTADPQPRRQLGSTLANVLQDPDIRGLVEETLRETTPTGRISIPGRESALTELQRRAYLSEFEPFQFPETPKVVPGEPTRSLERPEGGPAQYGKLSYGAEAPTLLRNVPQPERVLSEQERLMAQSFVPAEGTAALGQQKGLGVKAAQEKAARERGETGAIRPKGSERREAVLWNKLMEELRSLKGMTGLPDIVLPLDPERMTTIPDSQKPPPRQWELPISSLTDDQLANALGAVETKLIDAERLGDPDAGTWFSFFRGINTELTKRGLPSATRPGGVEKREAEVPGITIPQPEEGWVSAFDRRRRSEEGTGADWLLQMGKAVAEKLGIRGGAKVPGRQLLNRLQSLVAKGDIPQAELDYYKSWGLDEWLTPARSPDELQRWMLEHKPAPDNVVVRKPMRTEMDVKDPAEQLDRRWSPEDLKAEAGRLNRLYDTDRFEPSKLTIAGDVIYRHAPGISPRVSYADLQKEGFTVSILGKGEGGLRVKEAQERGAKRRGETGAILPKGSEGKPDYVDPKIYEEAAKRNKYSPFDEFLDTHFIGWPQPSRDLVKKTAVRDGELMDDLTAAGYSVDVSLADKPPKGNPSQKGIAFTVITKDGKSIDPTTLPLNLRDRAMEWLTRNGEFYGISRNKLEDFVQREVGGFLEPHEAEAAIGDWYSVRQKVWDENPDLAYFIENTLHEGYERPEAKPGGLGVKAAQERSAAKGGEAGAFTLPPILQKVVDALSTLRPEPGKPLTDAEVEFGTKSSVIKFRSYDTEKKIATTPQGIGRIPGLGQVFDPRATAKDPVMRAILTGQSMTFKGKQIATLFLEATKVLPRAFMEDNTGRATLADGTKLPTSTVIRREIANPGSQPLTPAQREFVIMWRTLRRGLVNYARDEGVRRVVDDQGTVVNLSKYSFPTSSYYDYHTGRILREPDAFVRVSKFMEAIYSAIAATRISRDPALQGRPQSSGPTTLAEGGSFVPWARGRVFPKEIADEINRYYGAQPHSFARRLTSANDFLKSVKYTMDVSAPLNQGLLMMTRFPLRWAHATVRSYAALADPSQFSKYLQPRMQDAIEFVTHGGSLGSLQDFLIGAQKGALASRIPVVKDVVYPFIKRSAESMNTFLSIAKLEMFRAWKQSVETKDIPKLVEAIENMALSGRMEAIGLTPARNLAERLLFNAPSYLRGAANLIAAIPQGGPQGMVARQSLATLGGALSLLMYGLYKGSDFTEEQIKERFDPGSSKFLKYPTKLSNGDMLEIGPGNVVIQIARLIGNTLDVASGKKPSGSGVEGNPILRWFSYRVSPLGQLTAEIYTGKDYLWRDITMKEALARQMLPISTEQFWGREKAGTKGAMALTSFLGVSTFPENYTATRTRLQEEFAKELYSLDYGSLKPRERAKVTEAIQPRLDEKREETGPPSLAYIEKMNVARKERITNALSEEQRGFLERNKLALPGYRLQSTVRGTEIHFTKEEEERYEAFLVEEYKKAVDRLMANTEFDGLSTKTKEVRFDRLTERARENAKRRLEREIRAVQ